MHDRKLVMLGLNCLQSQQNIRREKKKKEALLIE
jgi:hypothetical protein